MKPTVNQALVDALRTALAAHADGVAAPAMQAYMKSALPFHGVAAPLRRRLQAQAVAQHPCTDTRELGATMQALWRQATHREERYAAMELARVRPHGPLLDLRLLPLYQAMVVDGAWWDIGDDISGTALPALLLRHPGPLKAALRAWANGDDLWLRRAAMLAQRRLDPAAFDAVLFDDCLRPSLDDPRFAGAFFIRKGMGWALRERSRHAPREVQAFCRRHRAQLSPLTLREALRRIRRCDNPAEPADLH